MPKPTTGPTVSSGVEVRAPARKNRQFSPADKLRIVRAANECTERGAVEALLRKEGVYSSLLSKWRRAIEANGVEGLGLRKPGRKSNRDLKDRRIEDLERKLARAEKEIAISKGLLELQKKVSDLLGIRLLQTGDS